MSLKVLIGISLIFILSGFSSEGRTQSIDEYSLEVYLALQERADASFELMQSVSKENPSRRAWAETALSDRLELERYLNNWADSGSMPDNILAVVPETQLILSQNLVAIQSELGHCTESRLIAERIDQYVEAHLDEEQAAEAALFAWVEVGRCNENIEQTETTEIEQIEQADLDERHVEESKNRFHAEWIVVAGGTLLTAAGVYIGAVLLPQTNEDIDAWNLQENQDIDEGNELDDQAKQQNMLSAILLGTGATAIVGGLIWHFSRSNDSNNASAQLQFIPTFQGGNLQITWQF